MTKGQRPAKGTALMPTIGLNRQFFEWHEGALSDPDCESASNFDPTLTRR
jgi:hypothetical protein